MVEKLKQWQKENLYIPHSSDKTESEAAL